MENTTTFKSVSPNNGFSISGNTRPAKELPDCDMVNPPSPYVADMRNCEERLKTFEEWPKYLKPGASDLAMAGFYYTGMGDRVMCFSCKVILKNWKPADTVWGEHLRWNPACEYLKMAYCRPKSSFTHFRSYDVYDNSSKWDSRFLKNF